MSPPKNRPSADIEHKRTHHRAAPTPTKGAAHPSFSPVLALQQAAGNAAVGALVEGSAASKPRVVSVTFIKNGTVAWLALDTGDIITLNVTYDGHPGEGHYIVQRTPSPTADASAPPFPGRRLLRRDDQQTFSRVATGKANARGNVLEFAWPQGVDWRADGSYDFLVRGNYAEGMGEQAAGGAGPSGKDAAPTTSAAAREDTLRSDIDVIFPSRAIAALVEDAMQKDELGASHKIGDVLASSPAQFIAVQDELDMAKVLAYVSDWDAVRIGAVGPVRDGRKTLNRKRASYIVRATHDYGPAAEPFVFWSFQSMFDDDMKSVLQLLADDRSLRNTVARMEAVKKLVADRGVTMPPDRESTVGDFFLGMWGAAGDFLDSSELGRLSSTARFATEIEGLPEDFRDAVFKIVDAMLKESLTPGNVLLGMFDQLTFGIPLGFYSLVVGTGKGIYDVATGNFDDAGRELFGATVLVLSFLGGKAYGALTEGGAPKAGGVLGPRGPGQFSMPSYTGPLTQTEARIVTILRLGGTEQAILDRLFLRLGDQGMLRVGRYIRANPEAAIFVHRYGEVGVIALDEAAGDVARAQAMLPKYQLPAPRPIPEAPAGAPQPTSAVDQPKLGEGSGITKIAPFKPAPGAARIGSIQGLRRNWERAVIKAVNSRYKTKHSTFEAAHAEFQARIKRLGTVDKQLARDEARKLFNGSRRRFYLNESKFPTQDWSPAEKARLENKGTAFEPTVQLDHGPNASDLREIQDRPDLALDPDNIEWTTGGPRGALPLDSPHGRKTAQTRWERTGK